MGPDNIVALIIAGVVAMVAVAFFVQTMENARQERHRRVLALQDHTRHLWNSMGIPANYMTAPLRQFLLAELKRCYLEILALEPRHSAATGQLKNLEEVTQQPFDSLIDSIKPAFNDHMSGQKIRTDVKQLVNHMVQLHNDGLLDKSAAQQQINTGKALFTLASIDLSLLTAREMEHSNNPKAALTHYANCLKHLEKAHPYLNIPSRIAQVRNKVETLRNDAKMQQSGAEQRQQADEKEQWAEMMKSDQADWKIKQDYE